MSTALDTMDPRSTVRRTHYQSASTHVVHRVQAIARELLEEALGYQLRELSTIEEAKLQADVSQALTTGATSGAKIMLVALAVGAAGYRLGVSLSPAAAERLHDQLEELLAGL